MAVQTKTLTNIPIDREVKERANGGARLYFGVYAFISFWLATEFMAWSLHFDRALRDQQLMPYLYNPWALAYPWSIGPHSFLFAHYRSGAFTQHMYLIIGLAWLIFIVGAAFSLRYALKKRKRLITSAPRTHDFDGSAHWASREEVGRTGLLPPDHPASILGHRANKKLNPLGTGDLEDVDAWKRRPGIYVGEYIDPETGKRVWLRDTSNRHAFLAAPTRGGKGVGIIVPACLTWSESLFVNDPKGELFEITSWYRKHKMGQLVFKFDPACTDGTGCRINPLDFVRIRTEYEVQDAQSIALNICDPQGLGLDTGSDSDHWRKTAYAFLTGVILHVLYCREIPKQKKTLTGIDEFLSNPNKSQKTIFTEMLNYEHDPLGERGWIDGNGQLTTTCANVAMAARNMLDKPDGERGSVMSSVQSYFDLYRDPIVAKNIATSDFSPEDLMYGDKAMTLYMVNLPKHMERIRPLMRLITSIVMQTFTGALDFENSRPKDKFKHPMLMLMDEFTSTLSKMSVFANSISFVAGYGIKIMIVVQDLVQLADVYGDKGAQALTSNVHTQIVYATNNPDTARQYSQMLGNATIRTETRSWNSGSGGKASRSESFRGRPLLEASEIQALHETDEIVMVTGYAPIHCKKIVYHREPAFMNRVHPALKTSDRIPEQEQCYYKALQGFLEEGKIAAAERKRTYGIPEGAVGHPAPAYVEPDKKSKQVDKIKKKVWGQLTPADLTDDDDDAKFIDDLTNMI
jgi:type IV secretion system protein VirD4